MRKHYMRDTDDCLRTAIACLLEVDDPLEVPHFHADHNATDDEVTADINRYLKSWGLRKYGYGYPGSVPLSDILKVQGANNPNVNYMLFGQTAAGVPHVVICRNAEVWHNPSPWGGEVVQPHLGVWSIVILIPEVLCYE